MKELLRIKVSDFLDLLDSLPKSHRFPSYQSVKQSYTNLYKIIEEKEEIKEDDFDVIQNCIRMVLEGPPDNYNLGLELLNRMDDIYKIKHLMFKNN